VYIYIHNLYMCSYIYRKREIWIMSYCTFGSYMENVCCFTTFEIFLEVLSGVFYFYKQMASFDGVKYAIKSHLETSVYIYIYIYTRVYDNDIMI